LKPLVNIGSRILCNYFSFVNKNLFFKYFEEITSTLIKLLKKKSFSFHIFNGLKKLYLDLVHLYTYTYCTACTYRYGLMVIIIVVKTSGEYDCMSNISIVYYICLVCIGTMWVSPGANPRNLKWHTIWIKWTRVQQTKQ